MGATPMRSPQGLGSPLSPYGSRQRGNSLPPIDGQIATGDTAGGKPSEAALAHAAAVIAGGQVGGGGAKPFTMVKKEKKKKSRANSRGATAILN